MLGNAQQSYCFHTKNLYYLYLLVVILNVVEHLRIRVMVSIYGVQLITAINKQTVLHQGLQLVVLPINHGILHPEIMPEHLKESTLVY